MYRDHIVKPRATDSLPFMAMVAVAVFLLACVYGVGCEDHCCPKKDTH